MDKRATKILFDGFWSPAGWTRRPVSAGDFAYAKAAGIMFDHAALSHREIVRRAIAIRDALTPREVADGFLSSLSSRRLDLRSALGSYAFLRLFPAHESASQVLRCDVCGTVESGDPIDFNVLSFERLKWGGVRHDQPVYALFDLERFSASVPPKATQDDVAVFRELIRTIQSFPKEATAATVSKQLSFPGFKSSKPERDVLIAILGLCGILETAEHLGYFSQWVPTSKRELPPRRFVDMAYPACWWQRSDGINMDALDFFFGHVL